ncbi:MAG: polynucleotide adenylyltransferase PcnB [Lysobacteraceae bacterium]
MDSSSPSLRVIPREQHPISRKQISPNALRVLYRLNEAGFAAYLVGGAVRDLLLGMSPKDFDVATDATPEQVKQLFRNCRLIGRRFRLAHVVFGPEIIEVATFRANGDDGTGARELDNGRLVRDNIYGSIEEDAVRRDFTANALYYTVTDFSVRDYVGGYDDVMARTLRLIGDPEARYREDPVRMLRAARLAAKLDFSIEAASAEPIPRLANLLAEASNARLFDECLKLFLAGHALRGFQLLEQTGLFPALMPDAARALAADGSGLCRALIVRALTNTDVRIAQEKSVTPSFLFAALLWPAYAQQLQELINAGHDLAVAEQRAADRVVMRQQSLIAIPRRFSLPMQEIWWLQSRFDTRQRKRVFRFLEHPRFRAAYDFLELRASVVPELAAERDFWMKAQQASPEALSTLLSATPAQADPKPRRRRRRRRPSGSE